MKKILYSFVLGLCIAWNAKEFYYKNGNLEVVPILILVLISAFPLFLPAQNRLQKKGQKIKSLIFFICCLFCIQIITLIVLGYKSELTWMQVIREAVLVLILTGSLQVYAIFSLIAEKRKMSPSKKPLIKEA